MSNWMKATGLGEKCVVFLGPDLFLVSPAGVRPMVKSHSYGRAWHGRFWRELGQDILELILDTERCRDPVSVLVTGLTLTHRHRLLVLLYPGPAASHRSLGHILGFISFVVRQQEGFWSRCLASLC